MNAERLIDENKKLLGELGRVLNWILKTLRIFDTLVVTTIVGAVLIFGSIYWTKIVHKKGWFASKAKYYLILKDGAGLSAGDSVRVLGMIAGQITTIEPMAPDDPQWNVYVELSIREPFYKYIWTDSRAKVSATDFLGSRSVFITKGITGRPTYVEKNRKVAGMYMGGDYERADGKSKFWLLADEDYAVTEKIGAILEQVRPALGDMFALTNSIQQAVSNSIVLTGELSATAKVLRGAVRDLAPPIHNLEVITAHLAHGSGAFGDWFFPTNFQTALETTLTNLDLTVASTRSNLNDVVQTIVPALTELSTITSNLSAQVNGNTNTLGEISSLIARTDDLVQGLKHHWLLRSAFKNDHTNSTTKVKP
jgi:ABC-type transporter Mla subunit MlaD